MKKTIVALVTMAMLSTALLSGCQSTATPETTTSSAAAATPDGNGTNEELSPRTPLTSVTMLVNYTGAEAPTADNEVLDLIYEYTGTKLDIIWVPQTAFNEKLNTLIASQSLPQITVIREVQAAGFVNAARSGMFWDVGPYLNQYEHLGQMDENVLRNVQIDGYQYLLPRLRDIAREGAVFRMDWLDNLGMDVPTTLEELYNMLYAFTYNDPNNSGKDDTFGFSLKYNGLPRYATLLNVYMGGPVEWGLDADGNMVPEFYFDTYTESLTWFRKAYADKLFNQDFPVCKDEMQNFTSGMAGMLWIGNIEDAATRVTDLNAIYPDAYTDIFQILATEQSDELHLSAHTGYTGALTFSKTAIESEEELLGILDFLNKLGEPEMVDLFNWGIEGQTYTVENGAVYQTAEQAELYGRKFNDFRQMTPFYTSKNLVSAELPELIQKINYMMEKNAQYVVHNQSLPYISDTYIESGGSSGELQTMIDDAKVKYVIGEIDLEGWYQAIEDWKSAGGNQVIAEYTEQHQCASQ